METSSRLSLDAYHDEVVFFIKKEETYMPYYWTQTKQNP